MLSRTRFLSALAAILFTAATVSAQAVVGQCEPRSQSRFISYRDSLCNCNAGPVRIDLFSAEGKLLTAVLDADMDSGEHIIPLVVDALPAGVYLCRITTPSGLMTQPIVVVP